MASRATIAALFAAAIMAGPASVSASAVMPQSVLGHFPDEDAMFLAIYDQVAGFTIGFDPDDELRIAESVHRAAIEEQVDPFLLLAVIYVESRFIRGQVSRAGAMGLMQVKPATAEAFAISANVRWRGPATLFDIESNIRIGAHYLAFKLQRFDDDEMLALAAYCHGPTRIRRMLRDDGALDEEHLRYSQRVLRMYQFYRGSTGLPIG